MGDFPGVTRYPAPSCRPLTRLGFARELTKQCLSDNIEQLTSALVETRVEITIDVNSCL